MLTKEFPGQSVDQWRPGEAVVARYPGDNMWYRAEVLGPGDNNNSVKLLFVDYGQEMNVDPLYISDNTRGNIRDIPKLVIPVQMDIRPPGDGWDTDTLTSIHQLVESHMLQFQINYWGNPFPLICKITMDDDGKAVDVESFLIERGLARKGFRER